MEAYSLHREAMDKGDIALGTLYARQAWELAKEEIGDTSRTAILAYNYAYLVYWGAPLLSFDPLKDVIRILGPRPEQFGDQDPELMLAVAEANAGKTPKLYRALTSLVRARQREKQEPSLLWARAWNTLMMARVRGEISGDAERASLQAIETYEQVQPEDYREFALALTNAAGIRIRGAFRKLTDIVRAFEYTDAAIRLFPAQTSIENFDPLLGEALAMHTITRSTVYAYVGELDLRNDRRDLARRISFGGTSLVKWAPDARATPPCSFQWTNQQKPVFPRAREADFRFGGIIVGFNLNDEFKAENVTLVGSVGDSNRTFSNAALKAVRNWAANRDDALAPVCRRNFLASFAFTFD